MADKVTPKKRGRPPKLDPELVAAALAELQGNVAATAKRFNVDRAAVSRLIDKRPALKKVVNDARQGMLDHGESALYRAVLKGEAWAVCFYLKTQGKARGYVERQEVEQTSATRLMIEEQVVDGHANADRAALPGAGGVPGE